MILVYHVTITHAFFGATLLKQCCFSSGTNWMVSVRQAFADMSFVATVGGPMSEDTLIWIVFVNIRLSTVSKM